MYCIQQARRTSNHAYSSTCFLPSWRLQEMRDRNTDKQSKKRTMQRIKKINMLKNIQVII